ncbi:MdtA/MuxA family multidrug efflux RND transporter periplasmic adaptor subunit [uncultured Methylobacterium sp.]|jgi:multidrug efflux system membrane fusion protein|uniref:MdtA/MuxA family multidrug efflux RND transporter periplasmic adaptor subunit n=1 Tax=uncultured Methylobacterium sp. TaxID=157278 RepID=UPI002610E531|nr:MdtA/MuxA family multidrug efflux RND transporter periplasmic adaptor subunit [uncultured Methylobacterium sp.]
MNELSPIRTDDAQAEGRSRRGRSWIVWLLVLALLGGAGYWGYRTWWQPGARPQTGQGPTAGRAGGRRGGMEGPQAVGVAAVTTGDMPVTFAGLGTVTPLATVTMRSQVSGYLTAVEFREGQAVRRGDVLAQIDVRPYEALLAQYQGQLQRDQALLQNARLDLARYQTLNRQDSISKQNVDTQAATVKQYEGIVASDQAQIDQQKLNIQYGRIVSPVDGRVGLRKVDLGNYISAGTTDIVVVTQTKPMSVLFILPEDRVQRVQARLRGGAKLPVRIFDRSDTTELTTGTLDTIDNQIDPTTGTFRLRALFPNDDERLFPNQFVNVRLLVDTIRDATLVPAAAILRGTPGTYVYLLGADGKVAVRPVAIGETDGLRTVVTSGLALGDRVVVDGTDRLRDGAEVRVVGEGEAAGDGKARRRPAESAAEAAPTPTAPAGEAPPEAGRHQGRRRPAAP